MNYLHAVREFVAPISEKSNFLTTGVLTPQEFVEAGDFLVYKCPTWKWSGGDPSKRKSYLPADKQYLVTKNVSCAERCAEGLDQFPEHHEGEWTIYDDREEQKSNVPVELDNNGIAIVENKPKQNDNKQIDDARDEEEEGDEEDEGDKDSKDEEDEGDKDSKDEDEDFFNAMDAELEDEYYDAEKDDILTGCSSNIVKSRTYDLYITWDKWYQTPRVWLFGYDENNVPLTSSEMFEDISIEHAKKTVTYEHHPHENYMALSIHPCKHAHVMKKLLAQRQNASTKIRADQYLCIFLKFIGTVIPTISYDYSLAI